MHLKPVFAGFFGHCRSIYAPSRLPSRHGERTRRSRRIRFAAQGRRDGNTPGASRTPRHRSHRATRGGIHPPRAATTHIPEPRHGRLAEFSIF